MNLSLWGIVRVHDLRFVIICMICLCTSLSLCYNAYGQPTNSSYDLPNNPSDYLTVVSNSEGNKQTLHLPLKEFLFNVTPHSDENGNLNSLSLELKPGLDELYTDIGLFGKPRDIVFIYPSFTQAAYGKDGFYDFYNNKCDTKCLTVPIPAGILGTQASSIAGAWVLKLLDYPYLKDEDVDKNPEILKQYKRVIVLHNEYVTKKEFDAITSHPDVIFLYPNALYAEVKTDYEKNMITLVRGHHYPDPSIKNGFDWRYDNSKNEYNVECNDWNFYKKENYTFINCYPEYQLLHDKELLSELRSTDPTLLLDDVANWLRYPNSQKSVEELLDDYNMQGKHIPNWVQQPANMFLNKDINRNDFANLIQYLSDKNMLN